MRLRDACLLPHGGSWRGKARRSLQTIDTCTAHDASMNKARPLLQAP
jgi:hypothetical protein